MHARRSLSLLPWARCLWPWCLWLWLVGAGSAHAGTDVPEAYVAAAQRHGVPPEVLYAVASTESAVPLEHGRRPWPWTLNVAGKGYYFRDRQSACEALYQALGHTRVVDVGIAQLNVRWQPQLFGAENRFVDPCDALDPYANLEEAAKLLRSHFDDSGSGDWLVAAGRYHRPAGGSTAARYRREVAANLARLERGQHQTPRGQVATQFASAKDLETAMAASAVPSTPSVSSTPASTEHLEPDPVHPVVPDRSLIWVAPVEPVSWIDPEHRWDLLVAAK